MKKLLIIEDEPDIQELLQAYLHDAGYETVLAGDGVEALAKFQKGKFDLILLDLMLPKIDGFGVCELIRRESNVPILMLTALDSEQEQLRGFQMEIDDYVNKAFLNACFVAKNPGNPAPHYGGNRRKAMSVLSGFNFGFGWNGGRSGWIPFGLNNQGI